MCWNGYEWQPEGERLGNGVKTCCLQEPTLRVIKRADRPDGLAYCCRICGRFGSIRGTETEALRAWVEQ